MILLFLLQIFNILNSRLKNNVFVRILKRKLQYAARAQHLRLLRISFSYWLDGIRSIGLYVLMHDNLPFWIFRSTTVRLNYITLSTANSRMAIKMLEYNEITSIRFSCSLLFCFNTNSFVSIQLQNVRETKLRD